LTAVLGSLKYLKLSQVWPHEEHDFTPWLSQQENLSALADKLGLELQLERVEVPVGPYCADILARDVSGDYVVIENQFNKTNHDHLGKLVTYGATLGASIIIWIAEKFSEEHQKAIQWLNENTKDNGSFFAVQLKVFQIDGSKPAVEFSIVEKPNELARAAIMARDTGELSEGQKVQYDFWVLFQKKLLEKKVVASAQTPRPQYWFDVPLGRANFALSNTANTVDNKIGIRVYLSNKVADAALDQLITDKIAIENEIGVPLKWNPNPEKRDKIISLVREADLSNRDAWPEYIEWLVDMTSRFRKVFMPRIKNLNVSSPIAGPII
jgi:hypothetical protein